MRLFFNLQHSKMKELSQGLSVFVLVWSIVIYLFLLVNESVVDPYMDEIFHLPQTQHWCEGRIDHWNDKISTGPALYHFVSFCLRITDQICHSYVIMRAFILPFYLLLQIVFYYIFHKLHGNNPLTSTIKFTLFPLLFFWNFLYYNEVPSCLFVSLMYLLSLYKFYSLSALVLPFFFRHISIFLFYLN